MKRSYLIVLLLLSSSLMKANDLSCEEKMAYNLIRSFSKEQTKKGLYQVGEGVKGGKGNLENLSVMFDVDHNLTLDDARKLTVETVNQFVDFINKQEELRPYLTIYPVTPKQVCIDIGARGQRCTDLQYVKSVCSSGGWIRYYSDDRATPKLGKIHEEKFEEAVAIVKQSS